MNLNKTTQQIHMAVQPIAMVTKQVLENLSDDSQTNLGWDPLKSRFYSRALPSEIFLEFDVLNQSLIIAQNGNETTISIIDKSTNEVFQALKEQLIEIDKTYSDLVFKSHYEIDFEVEIFTNLPQPELELFCKQRSFASSAIQKYFDDEEIELEARTWPHHFDVGDFFIIEKDEEGNMTQTIGIGWANADNLLDEPYAYVSPWDIDGINFKVTNPKYGKWLEKEGWNGLVLPYSQFKDFSMDSLMDFYQSAISKCEDTMG